MGQETVVVAGAGPTGLSLACGLAGAGVPVRVLDAAHGPATTSRALGLQPRGVEVLDRLGALGDLPQRSLPVNEVVVSVSGRQLTRLKIGRQTRLSGHPGLLISQAEIEGALRHRLAELGVQVEWEFAVTGIDQDSDGVTVRLSVGTVARVGWLVGCDGAHSAVRKAAGIGFPGVSLVERFLIADVRANLGRTREAVWVWLRGTDMLAAFPLPGNDLWRLMTPAPVDGVDDPEPAAVLERMRERLAQETGREVATAEWTSAFRIHRRLAETYHRSRILLAGDAAHIHSPLGGQGMNTGIGDAENLAWKLALVTGGHAGTALLDTYEAERRPVAADVLGATSGATKLIFGDGAVGRLLRDHLVVPLMNRPWVQRVIAERSSQLLVSYRGGPLARGGWRRGSPRPGDRIRDLACRRTDGTATRLHAELGARWAVLASSGPLHVDIARARLGEQAVSDLAPTDPTRDVLLVRPDGHLAWRGTDPAGLVRWLARALDGRLAAHAPGGPGCCSSERGASGLAGAEEGSHPTGDPATRAAAVPGQRLRRDNR